MKQLKKFIKKELRYGAHNYKSLPVVIKEAKGIYMYDINENKYFDFPATFLGGKDIIDPFLTPKSGVGS